VGLALDCWIAGLLLGADEACLLLGSADLCSCGLRSAVVFHGVRKLECEVETLGSSVSSLSGVLTCRLRVIG